MLLVLQNECMQMDLDLKAEGCRRCVTIIEGKGLQIDSRL